MSDYYKTDTKPIESLTNEDIENLYNQGYVLTRIPDLTQTRSIRIDLSLFDLTSENRRILKKTEGFELFDSNLPLEENETNWAIIKQGKTFYSDKFDDVEFSASKIREIIYKKNNQQFNLLLTYLPNLESHNTLDHEKAFGHCITFNTNYILHYCYPFYDLNLDITNLGMGMMLKSIIWAKSKQKKYVYLGSATRPTDKYKLQFKGIEWWDGEKWKKNIDQLKPLINQNKP